MKIKFNIYSFALGFVFVVFGVWQIFNPGYWIAYFPDWISNFGLDKYLIVFLNGIFDFIVGLFLVLNIYSLIFSVLALLHLLGIVFVLGITSDIAIRDIGLLILAIGILRDNLKSKKII